MYVDRNVPVCLHQMDAHEKERKKNCGVKKDQGGEAGRGAIEPRQIEDAASCNQNADADKSRANVEFLSTHTKKQQQQP